MNSNNKCRGVAQFGSALVSGTRGREFESRRPDQIKNFRNRMRMRFFLGSMSSFGVFKTLTSWT